MNIPPHHDPACWGCGDNPTGIRLPAPQAEGATSYEATFSFAEHHQAAPGLVHGGLVAAALDEACGLLAGKGKIVERVFLVKNELKSTIRFRMDPAEQLSAFTWMETNGLDLVGIFHSHPTGPETLSVTDIAESAYPAVQIVWSRPRNIWQARGFWIEAGTIHALGPGLFIYEVQQNSDLTYRAYDWDRPMSAGRSLHPGKSAAAYPFSLKKVFPHRTSTRRLSAIFTATTSFGSTLAIWKKFAASTATSPGARTVASKSPK